jgi:hypothetical protein
MWHVHLQALRLSEPAPEVPVKGSRPITSRPIPRLTAPFRRLLNRPHPHRPYRTRQALPLASGPRADLRARAAALLRAADAWTRLETDLRLLADPEPDLARVARSDLRVWTTLSGPGSVAPPPERSASIRALLASVEHLLDPWTVRRLRFRLPA